jgi:hypothetical protein
LNKNLKINESVNSMIDDINNMLDKKWFSNK